MLRRNMGVATSARDPDHWSRIEQLMTAPPDSAEEGQHYARIASQPLVFARLGGFLAGHMSLQEDPPRTN
jgi:hypothetical protein